MRRLSNLLGQALAFVHGLFRATMLGSAGAKAVPVAGRPRAILFSPGEGQTLVEFALMLPLLLVALTGVFSLGLYMSIDLALNNAANAGARYLGIEGNTTGYVTNNLTDPCQAVFSQMMGSASTLDPSKITVTYTLVNGTNSTTIGPYTGAVGGATSNSNNPRNTCANDAAAFGAGGTFTLVATYPCPIGVYGTNFSGCQISASSNQFIYSN